MSEAQGLPHHLRESAEEVSSYLADGIPPLLAADAVSRLVREAPRHLDAQIQGWLSYQHRARGGAVPYADLAFHALRKLFVLGELGLASRRELGAYLEELIGSLLPFCPEEDREVVRSSLERLRHAPHDAAWSGFEVGPAGGAPGARGTLPTGARTDAELTPELRRFALLLARLRAAAPAAGGGGTAAGGDDKGPAAGGTAPAELAAALLAAAASSARDGAELGQYLGRLRELGVAGADPAVVRTLSRALPAWAPDTAPAAEALGGSARALRRFVDLADAPEERLGRFREVIGALVDEYNSGSLARAVALIHVATGLLADGKVPPGGAERLLANAHAGLDEERLRADVRDGQCRPLLAQILAFFPGLQPAGLLVALEDQPDRARRRLLLSLLQLHGEAARPAVVDRLDGALADSRDVAWFWQRNLLYLLHRLPAPADRVEERELESVILFTGLGYHPRVVGEAVVRLSQIPHPRAEEALRARLREVEAGIDAGAVPGWSAEDTGRLRALLVPLLLRTGPAGRREVVATALRRVREAADGERVAELGEADLSAEPDLVDELLAALREALPRKLLGVTLRRNSGLATALVRGLAGTAVPAVRRALAELAAESPREPWGVEASKVLAGFDAPGGRTTTAVDEEATAMPATQRMEGDLRIFGLPNLLQTLAQNETSGALTLRDDHGATVGVVDLRDGAVVFCSTGRLEGDAAFYQLLERPLASSFALAGGAPPDRAGRGAREPRPVLPLLMEAMRRFDELERSRALVPDAAVLVPAGARPTAPPGERDGAFVRELWGQVKSGVTAATCEAALPVDAYRVRALLAHWLAEGAVEVSPFAAPPPAPSPGG